MPRRWKALIFLTALLAATLSFASFASAHTDNVTVLHLIAVDVESQFVDVAPTGGPPTLGDSFVGSENLFRDGRRVGFTGIVCARIAERHGDERADQGEVASIDLGAHGRGIGAEESPVAELGAGVPGGGDLIEHLRRRRRKRRRLELEHAPRARRVGDAHQ